MPYDGAPQPVMMLAEAEAAAQAAKWPDEKPRAYAERVSVTPGAMSVKAAGLAHIPDPRRPAVLAEPAARRPTRRYATMWRFPGLTPDTLDG